MKSYVVILSCLLSLNLIAQTAKAPVLVVVTTPEKLPIANDKVIFIGQKSGKKIIGITNAEGKFTVNLPEGETYNIKISAIGNDMDYNVLEIPTLPEGAEFQEMELTITYWMGDSFVLSNLNFETGKSTIKANSYASLDELVDYLQRKKEIKIVIAGYTDNVGSNDGNMQLSKERALAVKAYLVKKGVLASRLKAEGFGMSQPVADNSTAVGRAENRRTEIRIVE